MLTPISITTANSIAGSSVFLGNKLMTELIMNLRDNMRLYGITSPPGIERQRASVREHYELLRLTEAGDADAIAPLMRLHIGSWRDVFSAGSVRSPRYAARNDPTSFHALMLQIPICTAAQKISRAVKTFYQNPER